MLWRRIFAGLLILVMTFSAVPVYAQQAMSTVFAELQEIELALYGEASEGSIVPRLERAERDVFGQVQADGSSLAVRVQRLAQILAGRSGASMILHMNALEWMTFQKVTSGRSLVARIEAIEKELYGEIGKEPLGERIERLTYDLLGTSRINVASQQIPAETTIRIRVLTEINSGKMKVGDTVRYEAAESVIIDNKLVIPAGAQGVGTVKEVRQAGRLGRDGLVTVEWGELPAVDGTPIKLTIGLKASERNQSAELAAGAAIAGVLLFSSPLGLAAGALVIGNEHVVPVGTEFFAEVASDRTVNGLSLIPAF